MQQLLDSLRGAFGAYLMEASFKQVKFIKSLVKKSPNGLKLLTKHKVDLSGDDLDDALSHLSTKEASNLIGDLIQDTNTGGAPMPAAKSTPSSGSPWQSHKASSKQVGYVLSMMSQLGYANWRKSEVAKKFPKPPKTKELMDMSKGEVSSLIDALKKSIEDAYA